MKDLAARLSELDPEAGAALRAVTYFDSLAAGRPGLAAVLRGAAALTGAPAGITEPAHQVHLRVNQHGQSQDPTGPANTEWPTAPVGSHEGILWVERFPIRTIDAVVVERAAALAADIIRCSRPPATEPPKREDWARLLVEDAAPEDARREAARNIGIPISARARAVALPQGELRILEAEPRLPKSLAGARAGIGPAVAVLQLPHSWTQAQLSLRLTAEGTPGDPGPRIVYGESLGGLALLAQHVNTDTPMTADEKALQDAATVGPWMLSTLEALAYATSTRAAAAELRIHHSTLQERILRAEKALGWQMIEAHGRLRLQLALVLRRLHRSHTA